MELIGELESAGQAISEIEKKRPLLRGLSSEFDVTIEVVMGGKLTYRS